MFALDIGSPDLNTTSPEESQLLLRHWTEPVIDPGDHIGTLSPRGTPPSTRSGSPRHTKRSIISFDEGTAVIKAAPQAQLSTGARRMESEALNRVAPSSNYDAPSNFVNSLVAPSNSGNTFITSNTPDGLLNWDPSNVGAGSPNGPIHEIRNRVENLSVGNTSPFSRENSASLISPGSNTQTNAGTEENVTNSNSSSKDYGIMQQSNSQVKKICDNNGRSGELPQGYLNSQHAPSNVRTSQSNQHATPSNLDVNHLTPSSQDNTYIAPSNLGEFSNHASRSSQESLGEGSELSFPDIMSVSQYSEARSDTETTYDNTMTAYDNSSSRYDNVSERSGVSSGTTVDDCGGSMYSSATSNADFSSLRIMGKNQNAPFP